MKRRHIQGCVAIVTGASSGVGWQSAVRLGEAGVRLCVTARRQEALDELAAGLAARGVECIAVAGDVTSADDVERVVAACIARYGRVDILVNDAAVQVYAPFEQYDWAEIERVMDVSFLGYLRFARAVLPHFRRQGSGHVVNVASMLSAGAAPLLSIYSAAKHAVLGWSESLRLELARDGIAVSALLLPSVSTPMFDHAPTHLGRAPQPIPPTYDTDIAARAVVRLARHPKGQAVPVFLQGTFILWLQRYLPALGDAVLSRFGERLQQREEPILRDKGNLFGPMRAGVGPYGSVRPTPRWLRFSAALGLVAVAGGLTGAAGYGALRAAKALR